ncbi:MAG: Holliday junction branch migration protein RuvA [Dialister sp.]|nr:Holliday junction branch migration protein RuvA [Dialister sp.]
MIGYIKGTVTSFFKDYCFLEANGIGYRIFISNIDRGQIHRDEEVCLFTHMAVREDAILLYGFLKQEEYDLFLVLISVSKVGPKVAMGILSSMTTEKFILAIRNKDVSSLTKLPGIGKKTAERLIVELKDKMEEFEYIDTNSGAPGYSAESADNGIIGEATKFLQTLGYDSSEILPVLKDIAGSYHDVASLVSGALRKFGER